MNSRAKISTPVIGSLIDRLSDDSPDGEDRGVTLAALRDGLRRDLENLLNSRRSFLSWPDELEELDRSLVNYGLADFTNAAAVSTQFRSDFVTEIEVLIARLEPRISKFAVSIVDNKDETDRLIRFRIVGLVNFGGERQEISFDSRYDPLRCGVTVKD